MLYPKTNFFEILLYFIAHDVSNIISNRALKYVQSHRQSSIEIADPISIMHCKVPGSLKNHRYASIDERKTVSADCMIKKKIIVQICSMYNVNEVH
jgi:hypothetical protein